MTLSPSVKADGDPALTKLKELRRRSFRDQATWFLNTSLVGNDPEKCESVRRIEEKCSNEVKSKASDDGEIVLDEFTAHRILEYSNNACSVPEFRNFVEAIYGNKRRRVSLAELLIFVFDSDWKKLINSPECYDLLAERQARECVEELKMELDKLAEAARVSARAAEDARQAETVAIEKEADAARAADYAKNAELDSRRLLEKEKSYLASLHRLEETNTQRKKDLEKIVEDSSKGIVARNKANAELAILLSENPVTLRAARIKQEAATRKSAEASIKCKEKAINAECKLHEARSTRAHANKVKVKALLAARSAEDAIPAAQDAYIKALRAMEEMTKKSKTGRGSIFYLNADLNEQRRFLPKSQFVVAQKRVNEVMQSISSA